MLRSLLVALLVTAMAAAVFGAWWVLFGPGSV
jgi:hypothetical protein